MPEYLNEIEHAATETLRLVWSEQEHYEALQTKLVALGAQIADTNERIAWLQANPDLDDDLQSTAMYWESYFGPEKEASYADAQKRDLEALIAARRFSTDAQCGNILQYAKQGISLVHRGLNLCPDGRHIGSLHVKNVIWQSRNQAIHWDEGRFTQPVRDVFEALARDLDPKFNSYTSKNMAFEVVNLLGWRGFPEFERDMRSLG